MKPMNGARLAQPRSVHGSPSISNRALRPRTVDCSRGWRRFSLSSERGPRGNATPANPEFKERLQDSKRILRAFWGLELEVSLELGVWNLELSFLPRSG